MEVAMPLVIENNYDCVSLADLVRLRQAGYSVLKSPHVGNQHPSNLVCAALRIPMEMVSFTIGTRDCNFHPHARIEGGVARALYPADTYTPFGVLPCGTAATEYHQAAVRRVFPHTEVMTDMERMQQYPALAATVLRATNRVVRGLWYRRVSAIGKVSKRTLRELGPEHMETEVFQFSNDRFGWVVPNRVHIVFDLVYQALSSGRDVIYHLSGPQMVHYVDGITAELSLMYDAVRANIPQLPLVLRAKVVPVASARLVTHQSNAGALADVNELLERFGASGLSPGLVADVQQALPELTVPIERGTFLSQYDLSSADDLYLAPWMLEAPLSAVTALHQRLSTVTATAPPLPVP
jgi:hypothetical protein